MPESTQSCWPSLDVCRILVTNDDGIGAPGLAVLEQIAGQLSDDVWVVAPASEQSGASHSLTLSRPLRVRRLQERRFSVDGTPTDCVLLACKKIMAQRVPDLVLSGVNMGGNYGGHITYSGTIAAAMEATLQGIPAIALSLAVAWDQEPIWAGKDRDGVTVIRTLWQAQWPSGVLINVNFPNIEPESFPHIAIARAGPAESIRINEVYDPKGRCCYWLGGAGEQSHAPPSPDSDVAALRAGKIAITPLQLDVVQDSTIAHLRAAFGG